MALLSPIYTRKAILCIVCFHSAHFHYMKMGYNKKKERLFGR